MSFSEWKLVKLEEVCDIVMGQSPKGENCNNIGNGTPLLNGPTEFGQHHPHAVQYTTEVKKQSIRGDLLFCVRGSTTGRMNWADKEYAIGRGLATIRHKRGTDYNHFVKGLIDYKLDEILNAATGSTFPNVGKDLLNSLLVYCPPFPEQKAIAGTLSCLDDKIELNNRINKKLEEMAQAIFKSWFVDFEPFQDDEFEESELGRIPKGWKIGTLGDYAKVKSGYAFKSAWWEKYGVPVIKIKEIDNRTINFNDISFVSKDKAKLAKEFKVNGGDLLIAMTGATIGKYAIVPKMNSYALVNQRVGKFFLGVNPVKKLGFLYCNLKKNEIYNEIISRGDGSAQPNISPTGIESIKIVLPPVDIIYKFNQLTEKCFEMLIEQINQNYQLVTIRDTLLQKLMSGEISVQIDEVK